MPNLMTYLFFHFCSIFAIQFCHLHCLMILLDYGNDRPVLVHQNCHLQVHVMIFDTSLLVVEREFVEFSVVLFHMKCKQ